MMERRGFFRSIFVLAVLPFVPVKEIASTLKPAPLYAGNWNWTFVTYTVSTTGNCTVHIPWDAPDLKDLT